MAEVNEDALVNDGAIPPDDFHNYIERIHEVADYELEIQTDLWERIQEATRGLVVDPAALRAAAVALQTGHLVLQGPPGTGKSSIARALCKAFHCTALPVTAHEDWTIFEVIGRLELQLDEERKEHIVPVNGFFTEAVIRCAGNIVKHFDAHEEPQAEWLVIDEINRAYLDRAFGELFTVLGTDDLIPITLPHERLGNREVVVPRRFRILATLNSYDRQFVNSLSQAIRRRFTFVTIDIPPKRRPGEQWDSSEPDTSLAVQEFQTAISRVANRLAKKSLPPDTTEIDAKKQEIESLLNGPWQGCVKALFELAEQVRYVGEEDESPYLPIGTAQIIDTLELFASRAMWENADGEDVEKLLDWAVSVKLGALFDEDTVTPESLEEFATNLQAPFNGSTRRELQRIVAAGMHSVE